MSDIEDIVSAFQKMSTKPGQAQGVTEYTYDGAHRMLTIEDARGIVYLENEYDTAGRVIRQTMADGGEWASTSAESPPYHRRQSDPIPTLTRVDDRMWQTSVAFESSERAHEVMFGIMGLLGFAVFV